MPANANSVRVTFQPENITVEFAWGKLPYKNHGQPYSILDVALNHDILLDHACGGNAVCTTCQVRIVRGAELLKGMEQVEAGTLGSAASLDAGTRLGCQAVIQGPGELVVEIPSWSGA